MAPFRQNSLKQSIVTTFSRSASKAVRPFMLPNCTGMISFVLSATGTNLLFQITFMIAFMSPLTMIMILSL
eukprot:13097663-Ditylum_brightwellii.AAC.1